MNAMLKLKVEELLDEMLPAQEAERREAIFMIKMNFCDGCGKQLDRKGGVRCQCNFVCVKDMQTANCAFVGALDRAIEFHRTNTNDPHNVGAAVMVALTEMRDAFKAYIC